MITTIFRGKSKLRPRIGRPLPWPLHYLTWALIALQGILPVVPQALAAGIAVRNLPQTVAATFETPPPAPVVIINRTVPDVQPPSTELQFSTNPTDAEISRARVFNEPIISLGQGVSSAENMDLATALLAYRNRQDQDDASAIENFLQQHPDSPRSISLQVNLAAHYRRTSQFTKALTKWQQIWTSGKNATDLNGRQIVDQAIGDWASFLVTLGRMNDLKALLAEVNGRDLHGAAAVKISDAGDALWQMEHLPEQTFKCGPYSLSRIQNALDPSKPIHSEIISEKSTTNGTSLYQNWQLAQKMGLKYQMAKRQPGADIPLPAMVHWKLDHFSALTRMQDGNYRIEDPTFNQGFVSQKILDEEADYFLIPDGPLPTGWSAVTQDEGKAIFGRSTPTAGDPASPTGPDGCHNGMAGYSVGLMRISLTMADTPLSYMPPRGPQVGFNLTYAERAVNESGPFSHSNLGNQWGFGWLEYISDDTTQPTADVKLIQANGNYETFTGYSGSSTNGTYAVEITSQAQLTKTNNTYQCLYPDGSLEVYSQPDATNGPRRVFLTKKQDPAGNALTFYYDTTNRLVSMKDAIGQVTTLTYGLTNDVYKITKVTDPFNRFATFQYNSSGQLTNITDEIGISSAFTYGAVNEADFINSLTTPYGTTTFTNDNVNYSTFTSTNFTRAIVVTDPLGAQERYEFRVSAPGMVDHDPANLIPQGMDSNNQNFELNLRTSFFWDKKAMQAMNGTIDYTKAQQYTWLRMAGGYFTLSGTLESVKQPLESARVWNNYPGQFNADQEGTMDQPSIVARVLDDGTTQATLYQRNAIGKPTLITDPTNRITGFIYSTNNIDLLTVGQLASGVTNVLGRFTYNSLHLPLTAVDAASNTTYFGYNTNGQLLAMTNALNETVFLNYDTNGYLLNVVAGTTASRLSTNSFTYDGYGRVRTATDPLGYTVTTSYDAADRPTNITYMDGTYQQIVYTYLDPVLQRDRNGHWTAMAYDPLRHLTDTYDNLGRHTQFSWCGCGSLTGITDPNGNVTQFIRDLQSRVTSKIYPDLTQINYSYEANSSRLLSVTDAKNQSTLYSYFVDNNLKQVTYSNAVVAAPSVSFTYDTNYNRMVTMTDGTGTTTYQYYNVAAGQLGAGQLSSASNSFIGSTSLISYNYDALGRITNRAINGVSQQVAFDALHRVALITNVLGRFTNTYIGGTMLTSTNFYPNGQKTIFSYLSITNDERLSEIWNQNSTNGTISKFDYVYDAVGNITNWTQQADAAIPNVELMQYDPVNELLSATVHSNTVAGAILKQFAYNYDLGGNRTGEQIGTTTNAPVALSRSFYNNVNQVTNRSTSGGPLQFAGSLDKQGTVAINGTAATMNHLTTNFSGYASVTTGTSTNTVIATDYGNHSRTNKYQLVVTNNGVAETISYDFNGNETNVVAATFTNSYQFDAANRLVSITGPTNQSLFAYDGLGRRVQIIEKTNGVAYVTNKFVWCGQELCEQRDVTGGTVTKRFFGEGEQISGTNYYFTRDHLGSIREMVDATGTIQARYDYDPYGRRTKISGSLDADFAFTGDYCHTASGLYLTLFRAYDSDLGRWPNRDPLGEPGFETLHQVSQPLFRAQNPKNIISPFAFFVALRGGRDANARDWFWKLQEYQNLYEYVGNNPISRTDPLGLWWGPIPTHGEDWEAVWDWFKTWGSHASDATDIANMGNDTLKCGLGMYGIAPGEINLRNNILTNQNDSDFNPPMHAGGDR
jgi:RHS repeat-associated protein